MQADHMLRSEKFALGLAMAGSALNVLLWSLKSATQGVGWLALALPHVQAVIYVLSAIAFDYVAVVTTTGRRDGRNSRWSWLTALTASVFSGAIALDVHGGPSLGPWLHVSLAVAVFMFMQHLAVPRKAEQNVSEAEQLRAQLEQSKNDAEYWQMMAEQEKHRAEQTDRDYKRALDYGLEFEGRAGLAEKAAEQHAREAREARESAEQSAAALAAGLNIDVIGLTMALSGRGVSQREIAALLNTSPATVNGWYKKGRFAEQASSNGVHKEVAS